MKVVLSIDKNTKLSLCFLLQLDLYFIFAHFVLHKRNKSKNSLLHLDNGEENRPASHVYRLLEKKLATILRNYARHKNVNIYIYIFCFTMLQTTGQSNLMEMCKMQACAIDCNNDKS